MLSQWNSFSVRALLDLFGLGPPAAVNAVLNMGWHGCWFNNYTKGRNPKGWKGRESRRVKNGNIEIRSTVKEITRWCRPPRNQIQPGECRWLLTFQLWTRLESNGRQWNHSRCLSFNNFGPVRHACSVDCYLSCNCQAWPVCGNENKAVCQARWPVSWGISRLQLTKQSLKMVVDPWTSI